MRKPLSMKRLHMLCANFLIWQGIEKEPYGEPARQYATDVLQPILFDFLKYVWEHKDDEGLYALPKIKKNGN